jgi:hypothetical protein
MKNIVRILLVVAIVAAAFCTSHGQILATTKDGQRVVLYSDGTWKFEIEVDSNSLAGSHGNVITAEAPVAPVVKPPKPKRIYSLECSALVDFERDITSDANVGVSRNITVLKDDSIPVVSLTLTKSKKGPLMWSSKIVGSPCITTNNQMTIVLRDGKRYVLDTDSKANCNGTFLLSFGNLFGKELPLESMKTTEILGLRIGTAKGFVEANFDEEASRKFMAALNCLVK